MVDGFVNSSEWTVSDAVVSSSVPSAVSSLSTAHFISIKLTNTNFVFWRAQVIPFLQRHDLMGFVDGTNPCPSALLPTKDNNALPQPNPLYAAWVRQDHVALSMLISSFSHRVMHHALGRNTSLAMWLSVKRALAPFSRSRVLHLIRQLHGLSQGDSSVPNFIAQAQVIVEDLTLAGRPVSLDEQNLYVFKGLRPEFVPLTASLVVLGQPVSLQELADLLGSHKWVVDASYGGVVPVPTAFVTQRGGQQ